MAIPGTYSLAARTITTAVTSERQTAITGLEGASFMLFDASFSGTGGTTAVALIRSRIGTDGTWREVASIDFAAAGAKYCTLMRVDEPPTAFTTLSANTVLNFIGTELEAVITTTGTWVGGLLTVKVHVS